MRLAAYQMVARAGDVAHNLALIEAAAAEARAKGADVLVAPELAVTGYGAGAAIRDLAQPADGSQVAALADAARRHGIVLVAGFAERAGGAIFNSAALVGPDGRRTVHRKGQLYGPYERDLFTPGDRPAAVVALNGVKTGLLICYEVEFPEHARRLARAGAEAILVPTALPESAHAPFIAGKVIPVRAFENQVAVVYADHAGSDGRFAYAGRSLIAMPDGSEEARAPPSGAAVILGDYRRERYAASRAANPYLDDLRTDLART